MTNPTHNYSEKVTSTLTKQQTRTDSKPSMSPRACAQSCQYVQVSPPYVRSSFIVRTRESAEKILNGLHLSFCSILGIAVEANGHPEGVKNITTTKGIHLSMLGRLKSFAATHTFLNSLKPNGSLVEKTNNIITP
jgi:hypothetical protein